MSDKEHLLSRIRSQRESLSQLIVFLEDKHGMDPVDYQLCEVTAREVETGMKKIRHFSVDQLVKEILWN